MAISLDQIRESNPDLYEGIDDDALVKYLHETHYSDIPFPEFSKTIGYNDPNGPGVIQSNVGMPLLKGGADLIGAVGEGLNLAGAEDTGRFVQGRAKEYKELFTEQQSVDAQKAAKEGIKWKDESGNLQLPSGSAVSQSVFESIPAMGAMAIGGELLALPLGAAGVTLAGSSAIGRGLLGTKLGSKIAGLLPSAIGQSASEGVVSGLMGADETETRYRDTPIEKFYDVPEFQKAFSDETDPTKTTEERAIEARDIVARKAGKEVFKNTAVSTGGFGLLTGGGIPGMLSRGAPVSGLGKTLIKGTGSEVLQEGPQSYYEKKIQNIADKKYRDPSIDPNAGAMDEAIAGSTVAVVLGFTGAGAGHVLAPKENLDNITKIGGAQTVDDAIAAQAAAVTKTTEPTTNKANPTQYEPSFESAASKYGVPMDFLKAVAMQESGIRQFDKNGKPMNPGTSSALGVMQIIPKWHPQYDPTKLAQDADYNIHAGAEFLGELLKKHDGDMKAAAMDYYGSKNPEENAKYAAGVLGKMQTKNFPNQVETKQMWPDVQQVVAERTIPERAGGMLSAINDQYRNAGYVPGEQGQVWEKPTAEIKPPKPDADGIVRDNTVPGKDILQTITDQYRDSGYVPGEQGQVWEKPTAEIKETPKPDVDGIVRDNTVPGKDVQSIIDEQYKQAGYVPGEQGQVWEKPTAEIKETPKPTATREPLILGRTWDDIQKMQRKEYVDNKVRQQPIPVATEDDIKQLKEIGLDGLKEKQFYGVIDRLQNSKIIQQPTEDTNESKVQPIPPNIRTDREGNAEVVPNATGTTTAGETKQPWQMTRDEFKKELPDRNDSDYDQTMHRAYINDQISKDVLDKSVIRNSLGNKENWAKTRKELAQERAVVLKSGRANRATINKTSIHSAKWANKSESLKSKNNIEADARYYDSLISVHKERVQEALAEGKPVPQEVLNDYPDLQTTPPTPLDQSAPSAVTSTTPPILTLSKAKYIKQANTEYNKANPNVSKATKENAHKAIIDNYDAEVDKAQAALSFDDYKNLPGNKDVPEGLLQQSHDQLRTEYGTGNDRVRNGERPSELGGGDIERVEDNTGNVGVSNIDNLSPDKVPLAEDYKTPAEYHAARLAYKQSGNAVVSEKSKELNNLNGEIKKAEKTLAEKQTKGEKAFTSAQAKIDARAITDAEDKLASLKESRDKIVNPVRNKTEAREWLVGKINEAILNAPETMVRKDLTDDEYDAIESKKMLVDNYRHDANRKSNGNDARAASVSRLAYVKQAKELRDMEAKAYDKLTFKIPGMGTQYKVTNDKVSLEAFKKKVLASPGFRETRDTGPKVEGAGPKQNTPVSRVVTNFLKDGEYENAYFAAQASGTQLGFGLGKETLVYANIEPLTLYGDRPMFVGQRFEGDKSSWVVIDGPTGRGINNTEYDNSKSSAIKSAKDRLKKSGKTLDGVQGKTQDELLAEFKEKYGIDQEEETTPPEPPKGRKVEEPATIEYQDKIVERIDSGDITADEMRSEFEKLVSNKESIHAELSKMTKAQLADRIRGYVRPDATKADMVNDAYESMLMDYWIGKDMFSYSVDFMSKEPAHVAIAKKVRIGLAKITDDDIKAHADIIKKGKQEREEYKKAAEAGMEDPKTIDDYSRIMRKKIEGGMSFAEARMAFTPEQRAEFDLLAATKTRGDRKSTVPEITTTVKTTSGDIIETKHTKTGEDLFVAKAADRVDREIYNQWNTTAKRLGGYYSSFRGAGAVPGFQFKTKENAEAFLKYLGGDAEQAQSIRDSFADDKTQSAVDRLNEMADRLEAKADDSLNQDRKANTARRAGMAARAEANANADKALAVTMRNIANSIENGTSTFFDKVRQKVQVELLQSIMNSAQYTKLSKLYPNYGDRLKHEGELPNQETADYIDHPAYSAHRSELAKLGRALIEVDGTKKIGKRILDVADDVTKAYLDFAKKNLDKVHVFSTKDGKAAFKSKAIAEEAISRSGFKGTAIPLPVKRGENLIVLSPSEAMNRGIWKGDDDKMITLSPAFGAELVESVGKAARRGKSVSVPWQFEYVYDKRRRLSGMGIETPAELRAAVREYIGLMQPAEKPDKIKQMEREMIGRRNDGLDFFPTPAATADEMVGIADIKEGMKVLEPSAGMGHIAERIRESGVEPDVVEMSNDRKELLEAKGFNVVGRDFMDITDKYDRIIMNPPFSDRRDMEHVQHAYDLLNNDGRLVAIMGEGVFFGSDKKAQGFRDWLDKVGGTVEKLAEGTFNDPSLPVNTGVNARMVVIDKTADVKFSKTTDTTGSTIDDVKGMLPKRVNDLVSAGKLNVVQSVDELPGALQEVGNALYHTVWHGSPHDHNKFDSSKIGTGEGAQAFGYGLYFTDKKEIAEWYREILSKKVVTVDAKKVGIIDVNKNSDRIKIAKSLGYSEKTDIDNVQTIVQIYFSTGQDWNKVSAEIATYTDYFRPRYETLVAEVKGRISSLNKGKLYQVELAPEQDDYLDWDKPLSEQSEKVKSALGGKGYPDKDWNTGKKIYEQSAPKGSYINPSERDKAASDYLHSLGIRGIRYKAEAGKSDAYNYVIFSDEDVSITEKFSKDMAGVEALYDKTNDKLYLVADMLNKNNIDPVLTHELLHRALATDKKVMQTFDQFKSALEDRFNAALNGKGSKMEIEAARRVKSADTPYQDQVEEFGAYMVTQYQTKPTSLPGKVIKAIKDFLGAVRVYLLRNGLSLGFIKTLNPSDLVAMAGYGAKVGDTTGTTGGKRYSFAGEQSETADDFALSTAQDRIDAGEDAETVRQDTGWHKGNDGKWKYEIGDSEATLKKPYSEDGGSFGDVARNLYNKQLEQGILEPVKVGDILDHPKLFAAYPKLKDITVTTQDGKGAAISMDTIYIGEDVVMSNVKSTLLHELQHGIQTIEGFASGGSPRDIRMIEWPTEYKNKYDAIQQQIADLRATGDLSGIKHLMDETRRTVREGAFRAYKNLAGEVEARNVQARAKMDDNFLRMTPPRETADVPDADVIVKWNGVKMDSTPDIRYSRASNAVSEDKLDKIIYDYQDRLIGLKRQQQKVGSVTEDTDGYLAEELYSQRRAQLIKEFNDTEIDPLLKELHDNKIDLDTFQRFLQARHAESRNAEMARRNPSQYIIDENLERAQESEDDKEIRLWSNAKPFRGTEEERLSLSGMSDDTAQAILDNADPIMFKLGDKVDDITERTLDLMVEYGMETQESVDALKAQWKHYVPLHRDEAHPEQGGFGQPIGQGFSVSGSGMKQATGSNADVTNIMAHLAAAREQMITRGEKNLVTQTLANFIEENPDPDFAEVNTPDVQNKLVNGLVEPVAANYFVMKQKPNVVSFRVDGKDSYIVFNDKLESNMDLALSLQNLDGVALDSVEKVAMKGTRWFAAVNTQYNLAFGVFNLLLDTGGSMLTLTNTPLHGKQLAVMSRIPKALGTISTSLRTDVMNQEYQEFLREGGAIGFTNMFEDISKRNKSIEEKLKRLGDSAPIHFIRQSFPKFLSDFNTIMEHSTRFSAYQEAKAQGMSNKRAASIAKNLTINFNRKGAKVQKLNAYFAFLNAAIQGNTKVIETMRGPAGKQILAGGVAMGAIMTLLGVMNMGADEWDKIPDHVRASSFILTLPGMKGYVAIPLPRGFSVIPNVGRTFVESFIGSNKISNMKRFGNLLGSVASSFNPLGGSDIWSSITPTVADPIIDLMRNQDWRGRAIYKEDFNSLKPTPGFTRTRDNTSGLFKGAAKAINIATGGTEAKQGFWSPTGDQISYVFGQLTGGTGREIVKTFETATGLTSGEELPLYKVPVLGRILGKTSGNEAERSGYYDNIKTMFEHKEELETLTPKERAEYLRENPEARYVTALHKIELGIDKLKRQRKVLLAKSSSTKALDDAIVKQMVKYNMVIDKAIR